MSEKSSQRLWRCPVCSEEQSRHHAETERPFCDECESREAILIEMVPVGPGADKFYDDNGNAVNP